jgi:hypothetical protein
MNDIEFLGMRDLIGVPGFLMLHPPYRVKV